MRFKRRDFLKAALTLPASSFFPRFEAMAAPSAGLLKITAIKALELKEGRTLIRVDTDGGVSGYGECNEPGPVARATIALHNGAGRLPNLGLIGKDPLA